MATRKGNAKVPQLTSKFVLRKSSGNLPEKMPPVQAGEKELPEVQHQLFDFAPYKKNRKGYEH